MWIMFPFGFVSVTHRPGRLRKRETKTLQIRSRRACHLEALRDRYGPELGPVLESKAADYPFRIFAEPEVWAKIMARACLDIEYTNFKAAAGTRHLGIADDGECNAYLGALHSVWDVMRSAAKKVRKDGEPVSVYDSKWGLTGPESCERWGHDYRHGICWYCGQADPLVPTKTTVSKPLAKDRPR